jgi:hypothetical protein
MNLTVKGSLTQAALVLTIYASIALAQPPDAAGVHLTASVRGGQSTFHVGELIALDLSFSSTAADFQIDMASFDRNPRTNYESFTVEPQSGWSDPLDLYFRSVSYLGGVRTSLQPLGALPMVAPINLNEWVRFDQPGEYRVTVRSRRVNPRLQPSQRITAISNELRLTIVAATPEWQQETLQRAVAALNNPATRFAAGQTLRYLGTEAAVREMAHHAQDQECRLGLASSPFRAAGLQEMRKLLRDPDIAIDRQFLDTLALLSVPDTPGSHIQDFNLISDRLQQELISVISLKQGPAVMASVRTILESPRGVQPEVRQALTDVLIANFDSLSIIEQANLLRNPMTPIDRPLMVPLLRKMAERYQDFPQAQSGEAMTFNRLAGDALVEWYSFDAVGARPAIIREILRPNPRFGIDVLGILPEKELPEVEKPLVANFEAAADRLAAHNIATLIGRYAGAGSEATLLAHLDHDLAAGICDTEAPLLAWLLRVHPEQAQARLEKPAKGCRISLAEIGRLQSGKVLEALAIQALDSADGFAVADGAAYLQDYGSADAEDAIWAHFDAWSKQWTGNESRLNSSQQDVRAGQGLLQALIMGNAWLVSDTKLRRMLDLAVGQGQRQQVQQYIQIWRNRPWIVRGSGYDQFQIGWYHSLSIDAAKRKLAQFPKASEFRWIAQGLPTDPTTFKELAQSVADHGSKLW